jgi:hypothetical protein
MSRLIPSAPSARVMVFSVAEVIRRRMVEKVDNELERI